MAFERAIIFIDGSNFYHILKSTFGSSKSMNDFDFQSFVKHITQNKELIRTYYYSAPLDKNKDPAVYAKQQKFFEELKKIPSFELILCRMQKGKQNGKTTYMVKEDDIHIAVDMVKLAYNNAYDVAILVSTDGDFVPAIEAVKERGKKVMNIGFETKFSWHLRQKSDEFSQIKTKELEKMFK
ncbi:MAG: NYN domain-containing protein [archaeon]